MLKTLLTCIAVAALTVGGALAQRSPAAEASVSISGKAVTIDYHAPSVRGRQVFGDGGLISGDRNYPIWRGGADDATALHTAVDLNIGGIDVPAGDYTIYISLADTDAWELIINKQTGQWGLTYDAGQDLGRAKMTMTKPSSKVETLKYTLTTDKFELAWDDYVASVSLSAK